MTLGFHEKKANKIEPERKSHFFKQNMTYIIPTIKRNYAEGRKKS